MCKKQVKNRKWHFKKLAQATVLAVTAVFSVGGAYAKDSNLSDRFRGLIEPIKAKEPFTLGVTLVHLQDDFWKGIAYGIQDEAKRSGVELKQVSVAGAYGNVREQFAQLNALETLGVDYAVVGAASFDGYDPIFKQLDSSGTKVLAVGIPVNSPHVTFGVGQDEVTIGQELAKAVCKKDADGTVITIPGPAGAEWTRLRYAGFTEQAKECEGLKVLPGAFGGNVDLAYGMSQASDLLLRNPEAKFIYTPVIPLGMGAVQAVRQQRRDAQVVSSAVVKEAIPMIKDGRILAVASEPGILMGRLIVQYAIRDKEGLEMPRMQENSALPYPHVLTPPQLITPENADAYPFYEYEIPPADWSIKALQ